MRSAIAAMFCCLLLSFNTLAAALMAVDRCMEEGRSGEHQMPAPAAMTDSQPAHDCAGDVHTGDVHTGDVHSGAEPSWISATAELLCDQGGECQMGGAVLPTTAISTVASPEHTLAIFARPASRPTYPTAFWRPPRY